MDTLLHVVLVVGKFVGFWMLAAVAVTAVFSVVKRRDERRRPVPSHRRERRP